MSRNRFQPTKTIIALAVTAALGAVAPATQAYESPIHTFSIQDVQGDFHGTLFGDAGAAQDASIICGLPVEGSPACPEDGPQPHLDKSGAFVYPVDSDFGFWVVDFTGAQEKYRDGLYEEGFAGDLPDGTGVAISNSATDRYKVKPPQGTWCQGLGGNSVKCSTEHYTVMEHVLSCHEVIPYFFADPETGVQGILSTPDESLSVDCATTALDDVLLVLVGGEPSTRLVDSTPCESKDPNVPEGCQMLANDNTTVLDDLAVSTDYSVTLKDDGKALYRWGALIKRPNDMRLYARLALPEEWKAEGADYVIDKARLIVNHTVTNNPNDQLRPEDLENEAAIGVLPDHTIENEGTPDEVWKSTKPCFEGDGDLIDTEDGAGDPTVIGVGTYLRNMPFALDPAATPGELPEDNPYVFSADLANALTNAWYTTTDREPFEWSYELRTVEGDITTVDYQNCPGPIDDPVYAAMPGCELIAADTPLFSGPRWRLKPNKFGQDIPGLEIPYTAGSNEPCLAPPYTSDLLKYETGTPAQVVLNLLDWNDAEGPSPLATSKGWVDATANEFITIVGEINGRLITSNGLPMSDDFDLAVYVKGDRKAVFLYNAQLQIDYAGEPPPVDLEADLVLDALNVPSVVRGRDDRVKDVSVTVCNAEGDLASGTVDLVGVSRVVYDPPIADATFSGTVTDLVAGGECQTVNFVWDVDSRGTTMDWTATVTPFPGIVDPNLDNNTATASTLVYQAR